MPETRTLLLLCGLVGCSATESAAADTDEAAPSMTVSTTRSSTSANVSMSGIDEPSSEATGTMGGGSQDTTTSGEVPSSTGAAETGEPSEPPPPVFVATGDMGRSTISCDLGHTWIRERSFDLEEGHEFLCDTQGPVECNVSACASLRENGECDFDESCDCLHHPGNSRGAAVTDAGVTVAAWGWARPGPTRRTPDGETWTTVFTEPRGSLGGVAYGNDTVLLAARQASAPPYVMLSQDGLAWEEHPLPGVTAAIRDADWVDVMGGTFVVYSDNEIVLSRDGGLSWSRPEEQPDSCFGNLRSMLGGNGSIVLLGSQDYACTSTDGGETWVSQPIDVTGDGAWTGEVFTTYGNNVTHISGDGLAWETIETPDEPVPFAVRADPGTHVVVGVGGPSYEGQQFMRSVDGIHWDVLSPEAYVEGHRISYIDVGPATALCPEG